MTPKLAGPTLQVQKLPEQDAADVGIIILFVFLSHVNLNPQPS